MKLLCRKAKNPVCPHAVVVPDEGLAGEKKGKKPPDGRYSSEHEKIGQAKATSL